MVKVNVVTSDNFHKLVKGLRVAMAQFHTYQFKFERAYKIVLKGLHHTTDVNDIKKELGELGHNV